MTFGKDQNPREIWLGRKHTEESKRKMSESRKGKSSWSKGKHFSEEHRRKLSESKKDKHYPKLSESIKKLYKERKLMPPNLGKHFSQETREKIRKARLGIKNPKLRELNLINNPMKNPEFREKAIRKSRKSMVIKPNKPELFLFNKINSTYPNEFKLNLSPNLTVINGRIPDIINCNGQKKCINFNGIYWHLLRFKNPNLTKEIVEQKERKPYEEFGFKVLFIWEDELKDEQKLIEKIKNFINARLEERLSTNFSDEIKTEKLVD